MNNQNVLVLSDEEEFLIRRFREGNRCKQRNIINGVADESTVQFIVEKYLGTSQEGKTRFIQSIMNITEQVEQEEKIERAIAYQAAKTRAQSEKTINIISLYPK